MNKKPLDYYKAIYKLSSEADSAVAVESELSALVENTAKTIGVKGCSIMMLTEDQKKLVRMADYGLSKTYVRKGLAELDTVMAEALKGTPVIVKDATTDPRVQYQEQANKEGIVSMITLPLVMGGKVAGILRAYTDRPTEFSVHDMAFLSSVANLGATAISKNQIYRTMERYYQDIIDSKMAELAKVEEARDRLTKSVSIVAHDLKSPLAAIQSYFSMILGGYVGEVPDAIRPMIERSSIRIDGLLAMIGDLLDISRIEMGQMAEEMENVSLIQILETPLQDTQRLAEEKNINLNKDIPADLPEVYGSFNRLQQVFANLLSNAVKFTPENGSVGLILLEENGRILGTVTDTGMGIPDEDIAYVFKDFYRASNVEKGTGTGLGLSIVKRIVEAHGGGVRVECPCPETGKGSKFTFVLPLAVPAPAKKQKSTRQ
ncbi:MAG: GAF domain-containing sensor histidine kinase [Chloroflexi bacterium]|nr:GAF domain-containing sensor histidine kinase [Chloroflexota bacterium]